MNLYFSNQKAYGTLYFYPECDKSRKLLFLINKVARVKRISFKEAEVQLLEEIGFNVNLVSDINGSGGQNVPNTAIDASFTRIRQESGEIREANKIE